MTRDQIIAAYNAKLSRIQASRTYSDHAKKVMAAKAYTEAQGAMDKLRQQEVDAIEGRREALQRKMFGRDNVADAQTVIARRDANDRAAKLDNPRLAAEQLQTALREGDTTMAQAIAQRANEWGWSDVLGTYADTRPGFREAAEEYNSLPQTSGSDWSVHHSFAHVAPLPSILGNANMAQVLGYAEQSLDEPGSPLPVGGDAA
ncbi:hypothetical protein [Streptomyces glomeratus]|uniref:Uncharacterized protein n=1 Tax=Streptomyces glomeratus TaxID=284452 RepID=A0ABP6L9R6_9ACTN|nr:hypothetical protein [Streptomyces glomeratus]MCF1507046.1 hypothetical protein [Streptomyces glomeratus]